MMKKGFIAGIVFFLFSQNVFGQIELGVKGGFSLVNLKGIAVNVAPGEFISFDNSIKPSFHFGGFGIYEITEKLNLQGEFIYFNKGAKSKEATLSLHYISIPVLVNYEVYDNLYLQGGPEIGFLMAARTKIGGTNFDLKGFYNNAVDFTLNLGAKYQLNSELHIGMRYALGLSDLRDDDNGDLASLKFLNRGLHISVGYRFP